MSTINQEMRRLNNIANTYNKTEGEVQKMWRKKWYELLESIVRRINESKNERLAANTRQIH
jgi:hypothetical protein|tara:strand:+ start:41 stop:223 length:183 start_codon:yes stop_codon:yes gene_type:complete